MCSFPWGIARLGSGVKACEDRFGPLFPPTLTEGERAFQDGFGHTSKDKPPSSSGNLLLIGLLSFGQKSALERLFDEGLGVSNALWQCLDAGIVFQIGTSLMKT